MPHILRSEDLRANSCLVLHVPTGLHPFNALWSLYVPLPLTPENTALYSKSASVVLRTVLTASSDCFPTPH
jgi:hypothetical protein